MFKKDLILNKLCAVILVLCGGGVAYLDHDGTALIVMLMFAIPLFFAKENWIEV